LTIELVEALLALHEDGLEHSRGEERGKSHRRADERDASHATARGASCDPQPDPRRDTLALGPRVRDDREAGGQREVAHARFSTARNRALSARGFDATSASLGVHAPCFKSFTVCTASQTHGRPGGQVHPPVAA
jgi:hypothetical protein